MLEDMETTVSPAKCKGKGQCGWWGDPIMTEVGSGMRAGKVDWAQIKKPCVGSEVYHIGDEKYWGELGVWLLIWNEPAGSGLEVDWSMPSRR